MQHRIMSMNSARVGASPLRSSRGHVVASLLAASVLHMMGGCFVSPRQMLAPGPSEATKSELDFSDVATRRLRNGLTIIASHTADTNLVSVDVRYRVGSTDDPHGREGIAHFVEHVLFTMRDGPDSPTFSERLDRAALTYNAYTNADGTQYSSTAVGNRLATLLKLEAERMATTCSRLSDELIARERDVIIREIRFRSGGDGDAIAEAIFGKSHAYGRPVAGTVASIQAITRQDLCTFIERYYRPESAIVVVSGPASKRSLYRSAVRVFRKIRRETERVARSSQREFAPMEDIIEIESVAEHPRAIIALPAPPMRTLTSVTMRIVRQLVSDRMDREFNEGKKLRRSAAYSVDAARVPMQYFVLEARGDESELSGIVRWFFELSGHIDEFVSFSAVARAIAKERVRTLRRMETIGTKRRYLADHAQFVAQRYADDWELKALDRVNVYNVRKLAERIFKRNEATVVFATPRPQSETVARSRELNVAANQRHDISIWHSADEAQRARRAMKVVERRSPTRETFRLDNGLRVVLSPNLRYDIVDIRMVLPAGYRDAPPNRSATALLAATLLQPHVDDSYAALHHANVWYDVGADRSLGSVDVLEKTAVLGFRVARTDINPALWNLWLQLAHGTYQRTSLEKLVKRLERIRAAGLIEDDNSSDTDYIWSESFGLQRRTSDLFREVDVTTVDELSRFRQDNYRIDGSTLIVVGRFDADAVKSEIGRLFNSLKTRRPLESGDGSRTKRRAGHKTADEMTPKFRRLAKFDKDEQDVRITIAFPFPFSSARTPDIVARKLILRALIARRVEELRTRQGAAYVTNVWSDVRGARRLLLVDTRVAPAGAMSAVEFLDTAIRGLRAGSGLDGEFVFARRKIIGVLMASTGDGASVADELQLEFTDGLTPNFMDAVLRAVTQTTVDDMRPLLRRILNPARGVRFLAGPRAAVDAAYAEDTRGDVHWID